MMMTVIQKVDYLLDDKLSILFCSHQLLKQNKTKWSSVINGSCPSPLNGDNWASIIRRENHSVKQQHVQITQLKIYNMSLNYILNCLTNRSRDLNFPIRLMFLQDLYPELLQNNTAVPYSTRTLQTINSEVPAGLSLNRLTVYPASVTRVIPSAERGQEEIKAEREKWKVSLQRRESVCTYDSPISAALTCSASSLLLRIELLALLSYMTVI